jgi:hypothetical protein
VSVLGPGVANTKEQVPAPEVNAPEQLSPVAALTVTKPVGVVIPVTVKSTVTDCPSGSDGSGVFEVIAAELVALTAKVDWLALVAAKLLRAGQEAVRVQVPVPLIMVTLSPAMEHAPPAAQKEWKANSGGRGSWGA